MTVHQLLAFAYKYLGVVNPDPSMLEDGLTALNFELANFDWDDDGELPVDSYDALDDTIAYLTNDYLDVLALKVAAKLAPMVGQDKMKAGLLTEAELLQNRIRYRQLNAKTLNVPANVTEVI